MPPFCELHQRYHERLAIGQPAIGCAICQCEHNKIEWGPIELDYNDDRTAEVSQEGVCLDCNIPMHLRYRQEEPKEVQK